MSKHNARLLCRNCGSSLMDPTSTPSSPTPHLLRTIQRPDTSKLTSIHETLSHVKLEISQLDDDVAQVQALLAQLGRKRKELENFTLEHEAVLAPIRLLPSEILVEIFTLCMPRWGSSFAPRVVPLLVAQICASWRKVALSAQNLWSSITVYCGNLPNSLLVQVWMSRAMSSPLNICLNAQSHCYSVTKSMWATVVKLVKYCNRWKHVELALPDPMIFCLSSIRHHLPWLESLHFNTQGTSGWPLAHRLSFFQYAPRLRRLSLPRGMPLPGWRCLGCS